jgi:hypothetical protein
MPRKRRVQSGETPKTEPDGVSNPQPETEAEQVETPAARSFVVRSRSGNYASDPDLKGRLPSDILEMYECHQWKHAAAILATDFPNELANIVDVLRAVKLRKSFMTGAGGGKGPYAQAIDKAFRERGWAPKRFETAIVVDNANWRARHTKSTALKAG